MTAKEFLKKKGCANFGWPQIGTDNGDILVNVDDLLEEYHQEKLKEGWISVEERLPEKGVYCLWARTKTSMSGPHQITPCIRQLPKNYKEGDRPPADGDWVLTTHWMPLPPNP